MAKIAVALLFLALGVLGCDKKEVPPPLPAVPTSYAITPEMMRTTPYVQPALKHLTTRHFLDVKMGLKEDHASQVLGPGDQELSRLEMNGVVVVQRIWRNATDGGGSVIVTLRDGVIVSKSQSGLQY